MPGDQVTQFFDPFDELDRRPWVSLRLGDVPVGQVGVYLRHGHRASITLRPCVTAAEARCAITEGLVHDEWTPGPLPVLLAQPSERFARDRAADLLVSDDDLTTTARRFNETGIPIVELAAMFDVTVDLMARKVANWLKRRPPGRRRTR